MLVLGDNGWYVHDAGIGNGCCLDSQTLRTHQVVRVNGWLFALLPHKPLVSMKVSWVIGGLMAYSPLVSVVLSYH